MFLKRRHLEILKEIERTEAQGDVERKFPKDFKVRILELYILRFVELEDGRIRLTRAGRRLAKLVDRIRLEDLPEIFVDTEILKIAQLANETGYVPEEWAKLLRERGMFDGKLNEVGREILRIYKDTHPLLYLTQEILDFVVGMPKIGTLDELVAYKEVTGGESIVNALQAMRMLYISPMTEGGKAFATTKAVDFVLKIASLSKLERPIVLKPEDVKLLKSGKSKDELDEMGLHDEKGVTELGETALEAYDAMVSREDKILPIYILDEEIEVVKAIMEIEDLNKRNPDILPTHDEILKRTNVEDLGEVLHVLESKELVERRLVKNKDCYWTTDWAKRVVNYGRVTSDGMKAVTYPLSGDVPIAEWVLKAKEEGLVKAGITQKGWVMLELSRSIRRKPYLTRYDVAILSKTPKGRFIHRDELVKLVGDLVGGDEESIIKAIGEAEAKGFIVELQNKMVKLTELGRNVKNAVESAKVKELLATKFGITPTTFGVLKVIHENAEVFNKIWKEKLESKGYRTDEVEFLKSKLSLSEDEIKKSLVVLRALGFLGKRSITQAGRTLVRAYSKLWQT